MSRWITLSFLLLTGCAMRIPGGGELPPLPAVETLGCCWLTEEQVTVENDDGAQVLGVAVEVYADLLTLVLLDPTGRQLLTIRYDGDSLQELTTPPGWDSRYSHYLTLAVFLHHAQEGSWLQRPSPWQVKSTYPVKTLQRGNSTIISLTYTDPEQSTTQTRVLDLAGSGQRITVTTLRRREL